MEQTNKTQLASLLFVNLFRKKQPEISVLHSSSQQPLKPDPINSLEEIAIDEDEAVGFGPLWSEYDMWI